MRGIWGHDEVVRHLGECQSVVGLGIREPGSAKELGGRSLAERGQ